MPDAKKPFAAEESLYKVLPSKNGGGYVSIRTMLQAVAFLLFLSLMAVERLVPLIRGVDSPAVAGTIDAASRAEMRDAAGKIDRLIVAHDVVGGDHLRQTIVLEAINANLTELTRSIQDHRRSVE